MKIYFVRHGEKEHEGFESNLTTNGKMQVEKIVKQLKTASIQKIYCSANPRAMQTAEIISKELNVPIAQLKTVQELPREVFFKLQQEWTLEDKKLIENINKFLEQLEGNNEDVILSMHAGINRAILSKILDIPLEKTILFTQDIACLNIIEYKEIYGQKRWCINLLNSTHHLQ